MHADFKHPVVLLVLAISLLSGITMFYFQFNGYDTSIGWSLTTEPELEEIVVYQFQKGPVEFKVKGEKISLSEAYVGDEILPLHTHSTFFFYAILFGLAILATCATYLKQWGYIIFSALFIVFLTQLDLTSYFEQGNWVVLVPFVAIVGTGYLFQGFFYQTTFLLRLMVMTIVFGILVFFLPGVPSAFVDHFFANGLLSLVILAFLFIILVSEEILFGLLYILTNARGASGNARHWLILGGIYVANLIGYYLNRAGIFDFSFTFMNPYILLFISFIVALWSFRYKYELIKDVIIFIPALVATMGLAVITFSLLGYGFAKGMDGIYEGLHYLIIYAHLGFGFFFLAYVVVNFIDPLVRGIQIYKIVYKPQTFHYVTSRLAGFAAIIAFFALSSQVSLQLFYSAKHNLQGDIARSQGKTDLAITYYKQADFYGYNSHYTNYQLGTTFMELNKLATAREHFVKATKRYPSAQSFLNASNLQSSSDISLATSYLNQGLNYFPNQPELINNLGLVKLKNEQFEEAFLLFKSTKSEQDWNQAPDVNAWNALSQLHDTKSEDAQLAYENGKLPLRTNVLSALLTSNRTTKLAFDSSAVDAALPLHRQAYLLNASYVFADTILQRKINNELAVQGFGLQAQLRKALARNMYVSGKIKSAFELQDFMLQGTSGIRAGEIYNEMGLYALDQHAPLEAIDFFDKAVSSGYKQADFNKLFALLEAAKFREAESQLGELIAKDASLASLKKSLSNVFKSGSDTTVEASFNELYYRSFEWPIEKIISRLEEFNDASQQLILTKLAHEIENRSLAMELFAGLSIPMPDYSQLPIEQLVYHAQERPFDETLVLLAAEKLTAIDPVEAYSLLNGALIFNPYSIPLLKGHALSAIDINLPDYADSSLEQLSHLLTGMEYAQFEINWYKKKAEKASDWPY